MSDNPRIDDLRRRVERDPASIAFAQLAEEYRRAGQLQESVDVCRAGLAIHPGYLSARVTLGRTFLELNHLDEAETQLTQVLKSAPENLAAIRGLAEIHHRRGHLAEALVQYRAALNLARNDPDLEQTVSDLTRKLAPKGPPRASDGLTFEQMQQELAINPQAQPPRGVKEPSKVLEEPEPLKVLGTQEHARVHGSEERSKVLGSEEPFKVLGTQEHSRVLGSEEPSKVHGSEQPSKVLGSEERSKVLGSEEPFKVLGTQEHSGVLGSEEPYKALEEPEPHKVPDPEEAYKVLEEPEPYKAVEEPEPHKVLATEEPYKVPDTEEPYKVLEEPEPQKVLAPEEPYQVLEEPEPYEVLNAEEPYKVLVPEEPYKVLGSEEPYKVLEEPEPYKVLDTEESYSVLEEKEHYRVLDERVPVAPVADPVRDQALLTIAALETWLDAIHAASAERHP